MKYRARKTLNGFLNSRARTLYSVNLKIETLAQEYYLLRRYVLQKIYIHL